MTWALVYVREGADWKLMREGSAVDALAEGLVQARTEEEREQMLRDDAGLVTDGLLLALSRFGGQAAALRNYPLAQAGFERMRDVARRIGNERLEGEALQNLASALYFQRNLPTSLKVYEEGLAIARRRDDDSGISNALLGIATIQYSQAEYGAALTSYREVLAIQERLGDEGFIATALTSIGNVFYVQGDYPSAIA